MHKSLWLWIWFGNTYWIWFLIWQKTLRRKMAETINFSGIFKPFSTHQKDMISAHWGLKAEKNALFSCLFQFVPWSLTLSLSLCLLQTPEELEDDSDFEQEDYDTRSRTSVQTEDDQLIAGQSARVSGCSHPFCAATAQMHMNIKADIKNNIYLFWVKSSRNTKVTIVLLLCIHSSPFPVYS